MWFRVWVVWTFLVGATPGFFVQDWCGPVIPGPTNIAALVMPIVAMELVAIAYPESIKHRVQGGLAACLVNAGAVFMVASLALRAACAVNAFFGVFQYATQSLLETLIMPCEVLAVLGWVVLALRLDVGKDGAQHANPSPSRLSAGVFLISALWPCLVLATGLLPYGNEMLLALHDPMGKVFFVWAMVACGLSGLFLTCSACLLRRRGPLFTNLTFYLFGSAVFRSCLDVARELLEAYRAVSPKAMIPLLAAYILLIIFLATIMYAGQGLRSRVAAHVRAAEHEGEARLPNDSLDLIPDVLTERERTIVSDTLEGLTARQIAGRHGLAESTVATYRKRAYEKLGINNKKELLASFKTRISDDAPVGGDASKSVPGDYGTLRPQASRWLPYSRRFLLGFGMLICLFLAPVSTVSLDAAPYRIDIGVVFVAIPGLSLIAFGFVLADLAQRTGSAPGDSVDALTGFLRVLSGCVPLGMGMLIGHSWSCGDSVSGSIAGFAGAHTLMVACILGMALLVAGICFAVPSCRQQLIHTWAHFKNALSPALPPSVSGRTPITLLGCGMLLYTLPYELSLAVSLALVSPYRRFAEAILSGAALLLAAVSLVRLVSGARSRTAPVDGTRLSLEKRGLSDIQIEVVMMTLDGESTDSIAQKLYIAPSTVRSYRSRACKTLGIDDLGEYRTATD